MKRKTILAIVLISLCFLSSGTVADTPPSGAQSRPAQSIVETPPKPEEIKFIAATPEQQKLCPSDMLYIPAGEFTMGSDSGGSDKKPVHRVYLDTFQIDKYEVTVEQYAACVEAGKCSNPNTGGSCNGGVSDRGKHPINCVDWGQSKTYCEWTGKRLPTEAEWEKAARGTDGRTYPWGNQEASCSYAIMDDGDNGYGCGRYSTWPVGSKPAGVSPYGAMDMAGNVWEWVADLYDSNYYKSSPNRNPMGPASGQLRILRGGSWDYFPLPLHSSDRLRSSPGRWSLSSGFRCARTL